MVVFTVVAKNKFAYER